MHQASGYNKDISQRRKHATPEEKRPFDLIMAAFRISLIGAI